jgi:hypothetical protein
MKRFILSFIFCLVGLVMFAQIDPSSGLRKPAPEPKPNTGLFGVGRRLAIEHLSPKPTTSGNEIIGKSGSNWGIVEFNDAAKILQGNVIDTCNGTGLVVVPLELGTTDYQIFVTPISTLGLHTAVSSKTDSAFTVKFWLNDTAANLRPVVFDYLIKKN